MMNLILLLLIFFLRSSCFFSSLLKILTSLNKKLLENLFKKALPNDPVPPVISNVLFSKSAYCSIIIII